MSAFPDPPELSVETIDRAFAEAQQLRLYVLEPDDSNDGEDLYRPPTSLEIAQLIRPAFEHHTDGINAMLRTEAHRLREFTKRQREELDKIEAHINTITAARDALVAARNLVEALKDSRVIRISDHYRALKRIVEDHHWHIGGPEQGVAEVDDDESAWDLDY